jgi:two-component system phosphate regulon response regulator PhoB
MIEDEQDLLDTLEFNLQHAGYSTCRASSARAGLDLAVAEPKPDLVLLDLMLPDMPGTEVCRKLRASEQTRVTPIVMLTASDSEVDRIVGFEVGADDYVTKPFSMRELLLRVRTILCRTMAPPPLGPTVHRMGALQIDAEAHRVFVRGEEVRLTALEFRLLSTLTARAGRVQTRDMLLTEVWDMHDWATTRAVDTSITRLRKKLGDVGSYIETHRGLGYRFLKAYELEEFEDRAPAGR